VIETADMMKPTESGTEPIRGWWSRHPLNSGVVFGLTVRGVRVLPRRVSYAIGHVGTWMAWRLMRDTTAALAANLQPVFPAESSRELTRRALETYRSYAADTIDFLRALSASPSEARDLFDLTPESAAIFDRVLREGRGALLVAGHFGNWEIGGVLMSRVFGMPLTVIAMPEADPGVGRLRNETRTAMDIQTLEVRQSLATALQIRETLGRNHLVALLVDRHVGRDRVEVTLFGRRVWFLHTPALLGYLTGAPLMPCFLERLGPASFAAVTLEPIYVDRTLPRDRAIQRATQEVANGLESRIRLKPHLWYHFYRYWDAQNSPVDR
jgi:Kdo2-lipid IVA lauroyltransferase/acyltransferase